MEYRTLAGTDLHVSVVGLGCWAMGGLVWGQVDDAESEAAIKRALDLGVNFVDTAAVYGAGHSEEVVGRAIRAQDAGDSTEVIDRILEYAGRFPQREMGVMLVSDMHRAIGEALFAAPNFANWAQAISDVMLYE